ncbi:hypothetical protein [Erysipelothrix aquatica]|uniref:hypothetical protein n=1 Tax=Erysipelothrix aquatica TaxID=2683714 RepID=UPI0013576500|nr:hypothetical protein [Erysipelothrix aquatica]
MENIKAKVTQDIVDSIIEDVKRETNDINSHFDKRLQQEVDEYREKKESIINTKLETLRDKADRERFKLESEMRFEVAKALREKRNALLAQFEKELKDDLARFLQSDGYSAYLNGTLDYLESRIDLTRAKILVRKQDYELLNRKVHAEYADLKMGGLMCEFENSILDFSFETRFKNAMTEFINESKVNI